MGFPRTPAGSLVRPEDQVFELSWEVFGELCRALALKVAQSDFHPELVIGIAKAGVIPGAVVAAMLQCDFHSMKISRRAGAEVVRARPAILSEAPRAAAGKRVLVVDEICTSGTTLRIAVNALRNVRAAEIRTATVFTRVRRYKPDFHALETEGKVIFPWDRHVVNEFGEVVVNPLYEGLVELP